MSSKDSEGPPAKKYRPDHQGSSQEGSRPNRRGRGKFRGRGRGYNRGRGGYKGRTRQPVVRRTQEDDEYEEYEAPEEDQGKIYHNSNIVDNKVQVGIYSGFRGHRTFCESKLYPI